MATQTTYLELNKPQGTDLVNPLVDTNPNWDIIDASFHEMDERSFANCTEVVTLGVHAISRLNTYTKFLKWIATANYTAGETFTVDGNLIAATTPAGAALATNAYVTGSVVIACLNADDSAMTIFVSGTNVATDSERLGGELPSYYATASDLGDAQTDITNLENLAGNTSIVGIGDGTLTGAIDTLADKTISFQNVSDTYSGINTSNTTVCTIAVPNGAKKVALVLAVSQNTTNRDGYFTVLADSTLILTTSKVSSEVLAPINWVIDVTGVSEIKINVCWDSSHTNINGVINGFIIIQ